MPDKPRTKYEVTLFPPSGKPEQFSFCTMVDTDNLPGGIMFTTVSGEYFRSTLRYKVRPEPPDQSPEGVSDAG